MSQTVVVTRPAYNAFNENDSRYKCCCNAMHVVTGAIVIGVLEILGCASNIIGLITRKVQNQPESLKGDVYYGVIAAALGLLFVILMFIGIKQKNPYLVLPHFIYQILAILGLIAAGIILIAFLAIYGDSYTNDIVVTKTEGSNNWQLVTTNKSYGVSALVFVIIVIVVVLIGAIFQIWFAAVIYKLYRFYKERRMYVNSSSPAVMYQQQSAPKNAYPQPMYGQPNAGYQH